MAQFIDLVNKNGKSQGLGVVTETIDGGVIKVRYGTHFLYTLHRLNFYTLYQLFYTLLVSSHRILSHHTFCDTLRLSRVNLTKAKLTAWRYVSLWAIGFMKESG